MLNRLFALLLIPMMTGCVFNPGWAYVKRPSARGSWTGTLVPVDLYGKDVVKAVALKVEDGTPLPSPLFEDPPPVGHDAILVDQSWQAVDRKRFKLGTRVEVTGLMKVEWVKSPGGVKLAHEAGGLVGTMHAVHPQRIRRLPPADAATRPQTSDQPALSPTTR